MVKAVGPEVLHALEGTSVGGDFLYYERIPSVDSLLDYRLELMGSRNMDARKPVWFFDDEIAAVDALLTIHHQVPGAFTVTDQINRK